jgi:hypothetical protein
MTTFRVSRWQLMAGDLMPWFDAAALTALSTPS